MIEVEPKGIIDFFKKHCESIQDESIKKRTKERISFFGNDTFKNYSRIPKKLESKKFRNEIKKEISLENETIERHFSACEDVFSNFGNDFEKEKFIYSKKDIMEVKSFYTSLDYRECFNLTIEFLDSRLKETIIEYDKTNNNINEEYLLNSIHKYLSNPNLLKNEESFGIIIEGEIGSGKSTFLNNFILNETYKRNPNSPNSVVINTIIDFENLLKTTSPITKEEEKKQLLDFVNLIASKIKSNLLKNEKELYGKKKIPKNILHLIALDNLDIVYQKFCESYFFNHTGHRFADILKMLISLILKKSFYKNNVVLIVAVRPESTRALANESGMNEVSFLEKYFSLKIEVNNISDDKTFEIIKKRLELIERILTVSNSSEDENRDALEILNRNISFFKDCSEIDFEEINNISTEGLRNTVDLFYRISPSVFNNKLFERFFRNGTYLRKLHYLGDDTVFSQVDNGVFNIFLNNREYREHLSLKTSFCEITKDGESIALQQKLVRLPHLQTYWLKYFIMHHLYNEYLYRDTISPKNLTALIRAFSINHTSLSYEENLVRIVLLGLSEVKHGRLLNISLEGETKIKNISLTSKAVYMLEKNIIWSFDYLSVVMEDIWIQYPTKILKMCSILSKSTSGYCYTLSDEVFRSEQVKNFLLKIKKVLLFLDILEVSYEEELKKVKDVKGLITDNESEIVQKLGKFNLPNFSTIRLNLKEEIKKRAKELKITGEFDSEYFKEIKYSDGSLENSRVKEILKEFFEENYGTSSSDYRAREIYKEFLESEISKLNLS